MVWLERKVCAYIQDRSGPNRVGFEGALQPFADVIKLLFKEQLRPKAADAFLFALAPLVSTTAAFAAFSVVPFGTETTLFGLLDQPIPLQITDVNVAVLVDLRDHLDGHLRHRPRRLGLEQQVFAARRPAVCGADDQLRAVVRAGAGGGHHDGWIAVAAGDRAAAVRDVVRLHPALVHHSAVLRIPDFPDRRRRRDQPRAVRLPRGGAGARGRVPHRIQLDELRACSSSRNT